MSEMQFPEKYPELLQLVATANYQYLTSKLHMQHQPAAEAAFAAAEHVRLNIGGGSMYINKGIAYEADQRGQEIYRRWNGRNAHELAREFGLTEERIRQIVKERREAERRARQGSLKLDADDEEKGA